MRTPRVRIRLKARRFWSNEKRRHRKLFFGRRLKCFSRLRTKCVWQWIFDDNTVWLFLQANDYYFQCFFDTRSEKLFSGARTSLRMIVSDHRRRIGTRFRHSSSVVVHSVYNVFLKNCRLRFRIPCIIDSSVERDLAKRQPYHTSRVVSKAGWLDGTTRVRQRFKQNITPKTSRYVTGIRMITDCRFVLFFVEEKSIIQFSITLRDYYSNIKTRLEKMGKTIMKHLRVARLMCPPITEQMISNTSYLNDRGVQSKRENR